MTPAQEQAARITGVLWEAVARSGGTRASGWRHYQGALDPGLLAGLPLPSLAALPPGQPAALLDDTGSRFPRLRDPALIRAACRERPRTLAYESIGHRDDGWAGLACSHLTRLAGCPLPVVCTVYASAHGDEGLGAHWDAHAGAVVQVSGVKEWRIGERVLGGRRGHAALVTMRPGDILVVPWGMPHDVTTPADPGWSVHLAFAIGRHGDPPGAVSTSAAPGRDGQAAREPEKVCALCHLVLSQCRCLRSAVPAVPGHVSAGAGNGVHGSLPPQARDGVPDRPP